MEKTATFCPTILEGLTKIKTTRGIGRYEGIKISELGHIMIRVYFPEEKIFVNYAVGSAEDLLSGTQLQICE